jgi:hypothetical protein
LQQRPTRCNSARPVATAHDLFAQVVEERRRIVLSQVEEEMRWQEEKAAELARQRSAQHRTEHATTTMRAPCGTTDVRGGASAQRRVPV